MKKKTLKKIIPMLAMILVLTGLIIGTSVLKKQAKENEETSTEDNSVVVFDKGTSIVTAIRFISAENEMSFSYKNEDWIYDADNNFPLDQDRVASMAQSVGKVSAAVTIENAADKLSDYGLDKPSLTVDATFSDGSEKTFTFGDTNTFNSCKYLMISGDENVYMVEEDVAAPFSADLDYLYDPESYILQKESVSYTDVSSVILSTVDGTTKEITDETGINEVFELVYTLDLSEYEDYYADSEEMKNTYGISPDGEKITVKYTYIPADGNEENSEEKVYTVYIGHKFESAEAEDTESTDTGETTAEEEQTHSYFYTFEGSTVVYAADGETVDEIFTYLSYEPAAEETTAAQ